MIISRTPLRVSLFGGGLDYPEWFNNNSTNVINFAINQYIYILIKKIKNIHNYNYKLRYFKTEEVKEKKNINHSVYRKVLEKYLDKNLSIELIYSADLPALSGLGSSSSNTVGVINAIHALKNKNIGKRNLAFKALEIEREMLNEPVGYQDQIAASFGGLNHIKLFNKNFDVTPIANKKFINELNNNFYIYFTGVQRKSKKIELLKIDRIKKKKKQKHLDELSNIGSEALKLIYDNFSIKKLNYLINQSWEIKKKINPEISNQKIDKIIQKLKKNGANSTKLVGSGNGGFILFHADRKKIQRIKKYINLKNLIDFKIDHAGSQIVYNGSYLDM